MNKKLLNKQKKNFLATPKMLLNDMMKYYGSFWQEWGEIHSGKKQLTEKKKKEKGKLKIVVGKIKFHSFN